MRRIVMTQWVAINEPLEGLVPWMYCDIRGLVTVGLGNLVEPVEFAVPLPFVQPDGRLATGDEIRRAWHVVKTQKPESWKIGGGQAFWRDLTSLRLPRPAVDALVRRKLLQNESVLASRFSHWHAWPADAHLGVHSMIWAMGLGALAGFPKFCAAAEACDFETMAAECDINPKVGTILKRNAMDRQCFLNAATVIANGLDRERLLWGSVEDATPTSPEIPAAKDVSDESA